MMGEERWESSLRWSLLFAVGALASAVLVQAWLGGDHLFRWPLSLLALAYACVAATWAVREPAPGASRAPSWCAALTVVGVLLTVVAAMRVVPHERTADQLAAATLVVIAPGMVALVLALRWEWPALTGVAAGLAGVTAAVLSIRGHAWAVVAAVAGAGFVVTMVLAAAGRLTVAMRHAGQELVAAQESRARLAVADERLRFSRDLHDVQGRTLAAVSVHSRLGAELARRGDPTAVDHMEQVQRLADDALGETRRLVSGYRAAALGEEVESARALLTAAGISVRMEWTPHDDMPSAISSALAAVVREGVTNALRHSSAEEVTLRLGRQEAGWRLVVENDGCSRVGTETMQAGTVRRTSRVPTGLAGLEERLAEVNGRSEVAVRDGRFLLTVRVPEGGRP